MSDKLHVLIDAARVQERVRELADEISKDYRGKELVVVGVLKGAFIFMGDLVRNMSLTVYCDFLRASSYGNSTSSSGNVRVEFDVTQPIKDKHVLLVEDILDTGLTLRRIIEIVRAKSPSSLKVCALLVKKNRPRRRVKADYYGFKIPDKFVVGYGLDHAGKYRNLPFIATLAK